MTLTLPWPPSVNSYWRRVGNKTILSAAAREYRGAATAACLEQGAPHLGTARVRILISACPPDRRQRDLDNLHKGVLDALAFAGVFDDDSQVDDLRIVRGDLHRPAGSVTVQIEPIVHGTSGLVGTP